MKQVFYAIAAFVLFTSCMSSTLITSTPSEADVYVENDLKGKTPYKYEDDKIVLSETDITLKKEGYEDKHITLTRDEDIEIGPALAGFVLWPVWLWALGYEDEHNYVLTQKENYTPSPETIIPKTDGKHPLIASIKDLYGLFKEDILNEAEFTAEKNKLIQDEITFTSKTDFLREVNTLFTEGMITESEFGEIKAKVLAK